MIYNIYGSSLEKIGFETERIANALERFNDLIEGKLPLNDYNSIKEYRDIFNSLSGRLCLI